MRITKLKLRNFAPIWAGMQQKEIEIDFSNSKNRIVLLIGENGSGKTAILSQLHPFAHSGSMDVRSGSEMILPTTEGYKEIHYDKDGDVYIIKHFYQDKGMKSFISRNGVELNPNGNVKPFAELVNLEFSLDLDMMKLIRLGPNVTNFSREGSAKRKTFMANLMNDIDMYLKYYKKINQDSRFLKQMIKTTADKIRKLNIYDEAVELEALEAEKTALVDAQTRQNEMYTKSGRTNNQIETILNGSTLAQLKDVFTTMNHEKRQFISDIEKISRRLDTIDETISTTSSVSEITDGRHRKEIELTVEETQFNNVMMTLDKLYAEKKEKTDMLRFVTREEDYSLTVELFLKLHAKHKKFEEKYANYTMQASRSDMMMVLSALQEIDSVRTAIHEFNNTAVRIVLNMRRSGQSVKQYVQSNLQHIESKIRQVEKELSKTQYRWTKQETDVYVLYQNPECEGKCPYRQFYEDVTKPLNEDVDNTVAKAIQALENEKEEFMKFYDIERNLEIVDRLIESNRELANKLPFDLFNKSNIYDNLKINEVVYDEQLITEIISEVEGYEYFIDLGHRLNDVERDKLNMEKARGNITDVQESLTRIDLEIASLEKTRDNSLDKIRTMQLDIANMTDTILKIEHRDKLLSERETKQDLLKVVTIELTEMERRFQQLQSLLSEQDVEQKMLSTLKTEVDFRNDNIIQIQHRLIEFRTLSKEQKKLETQYDEVQIIRKALSSNEGIPLLFMQLYLKNTRAKVNQLLDVVYDGKLELAEFVIDEKEFRIPYIKSGLEVSDISKCSQGEDSFISLAFSFSLISQSILDGDVGSSSKEYNIPLFDEIDATLDLKKRSQFLAILENLLDSIWAEQVFLITHNNVFDSYPVDIIMTSETNIDNYKNVNVIFKPK